MAMDEPLFDLDPTDLPPGVHVIVQTIWGDEHGVVTGYEDGLVAVGLQRGDTIYISPTRCREVFDDAEE